MTTQKDSANPERSDASLNLATGRKPTPTHGESLPKAKRSAKKYTIPDAICGTVECSREVWLVWRKRQTEMAAARRRYVKRKEYSLFLLTFPGNQRLHLFAVICNGIEDDAEYWRCLNLVFTSASYPSEQKFLLRAFRAKRKNREAFMGEKDQVPFAALPDTLTIYRGYQERGVRMGLSWTLSKEKATWFAYRWDHLGAHAVVKGTCRKADVLGYYNGRQEQEIIIDPKKIIGVRTLKKIGPNPFNER